MEKSDCGRAAELYRLHPGVLARTRAGSAGGLRLKKERLAILKSLADPNHEPWDHGMSSGSVEDMMTFSKKPVWENERCGWTSDACWMTLLLSPLTDAALCTRRGGEGGYVLSMQH